MTKAAVVLNELRHTLKVVARGGTRRRFGVGLAILAMAQSLYSPVAMAQVISDPRAPIQFKPKVGTSANGTPVIDITKPSFGGISHNKFQRYDVDTRGIILNNSTLTGTSIIGGQVVANPNLARSRPARVILNEVTSAAASTLNGPTEVFGSKAEVIIANPNGITCASCSFVNTGRVTLSTGKPLPDYRRGTVKYDVSKGKVAVSGTGLLGLNEALERVDLIGRQLKIDAPVQAIDTARLRTGAMIYDQRSDTAVLKAASSVTPISGPAVQSSAGGKIAAGTLSVVSRELGVGVVLNGDLATYTDGIVIRSAGDAAVRNIQTNADLELSANGTVLLTGTGKVLGSITARGGNIEVSADADLTANGAVILEALQSLASRGLLKSGSSISLTSANKLIAEGLVASNGEIVFEAKKLTSKGLKVSGKSIMISGDESATLDDTEIVATAEKIRVGSMAVELGEGTVFQAKDQIVIDAKGTLKNGTTLNYDNLDLIVRHGMTNTATGKIFLDHFSLVARDGIFNSGLLYGRETAKFDVNELTNAKTGIIYGGEVELKIAGNLTNLGQIISDKTLKILAGDVINSGTLQAETVVTLKAESYKADSNTAVIAGKTVELVLSGDMENNGSLLGKDIVTVLAQGSIKNNGALQTEGSLFVGGKEYFGGSASELTGKTVLVGDVGIAALNAASLTLNTNIPTLLSLNNQGKITGSESVQIVAAGISNVGASAAISAETLDLKSSGDVLNEGTLGAIRKMTLTANGNLTTPGSIITSGIASATDPIAPPTEGDLDITAGGKILAGSDLMAAGALTIDAGSLETNISTARLGGRVVTVILTGSFESAGAVIADDTLEVTAGSITIGPTLANSLAGNLLALKSVTLTATGGDIVNQGIISASGAADVTPSIPGDIILNAVGHELSNSGSIAAKGKLTITAGSYTATTVAQAGADNMVFRLSGALDNAGFIAGTSLVDVQADTLANGPTTNLPDTDPAVHAGLILGKTIKLTNPGAIANQGGIEASESLTINAGALDNSGRLIANQIDEQGHVVGSPFVEVNLTGVLINRGSISAGDKLTINSSSYDAMVDTAVATARGVTINADTVGNQGKIFGSEKLTLESKYLTNQGAKAAIGGKIVAITSKTDFVNEGEISSSLEGTLTLHGTATNPGQILSEGSLTVEGFDADLTSSGTIAANGALTLNARSFNNASTTSKVGGSTVTVNVGRLLSNVGMIGSTGALTITATNFVNVNSALPEAGRIEGQTVTVTANGSFRNYGLLQAIGDPTNNIPGTSSITALGTFENTGKILAQAQLSINGPSVLVNGGEIAASTVALAPTVQGYEGLAGSKLLADVLYNSDPATGLLLTKGFKNSGTVRLSTLNLYTDEFVNWSSGDIGAASANISVKTNGDVAKQFLNAGKIGINTGYFWSDAKFVNLFGGSIESLGTLTISGDFNVQNGGAIRSLDKIFFDIDDFDNQQGGIVEALNVEVRSMGSHIVNRGRISATNKLYLWILQGKITNRGSGPANIALLEAGNIEIFLNGTLSNAFHSEIHAAKADIDTIYLSKDFLESKSTATGRLIVESDLKLAYNGGGYTFDRNLTFAGNFIFTAEGDIKNLATITAGGNLSLTATSSGSITNGGNASSPKSAMLYAGGNLTLKATGGDINNYGSKIKAGKDITITAGGTVRNVQVGQDASGNPINPSLIQAGLDPQKVGDGTVKITAGAGKDIENRGSTISSFSDSVTLNATNLQNWNAGSLSAIVYAAGTVTVNATKLGDGVIEGTTVVIDGKEVVNPAGQAPPVNPQPVIDLTKNLKAIGGNTPKGSGPAYEPVGTGKSGSTKTRSGDKVTKTVDAFGKTIEVKNKDVTIDGTITFLHATQVSTNNGLKNPSWILAQIGESSDGLTFYADPVTEQELIQQSLLQQIGRTMLDPKYRNPKEQQEALYQGTVDFLRTNPTIDLGDKLTAAQRAKIKKPILWYTYKTVNGKKVLVPELILPEADLDKYAKNSGGAIYGIDVNIKADKVTNAGIVLAAGTLTIKAHEFLNERQVNAAGTGLLAGGFVSGNIVKITTTGDLINRGGAMLAINGMELKAGRDLRIEAQQIKTGSASIFGKFWSTTSDVKNIGAVVSSGGNLTMTAKNDLNVIGSTVNAKGVATLYGAHGVTIASALDEHSAAAGGSKSGFLTKKSFAFGETSITNISSVVSAGTQLNVISKGDVNVVASHLVSKGDLNVLAGYNIKGERVKGESQASVNILSGTDGQGSSYSVKKSGFGLFLTGGGVDFYHSKQTAMNMTRGENVASSLSANGNINVLATKDITINGSTLNAQGATTVKAERDLNIGPGEDSNSFSFSKKEKGIGISTSAEQGSASVSFGYHARSDYMYQGQTTVAPSIIFGRKGVTLEGGRNVTLVAADIASEGHVGIKAGTGDLNILAGANTETTYQSTKQVFAGITLKVSENISGAVDQLRQAPGTFNSGYGGAGYQALGMASGVLQTVDGLSQLSSPYVGVSLTVGASGSKSQSGTSSSTAVGTRINAQSLTLEAGHDIRVQGAQIKVTKDLLVEAGHDLIVESAQSTSTSSSSSRNWNASFGIEATIVGTSPGGLVVSGGYGQSKAGSYSITQLNTHMDVGGKATFKAGHDATFAGAVVKAGVIDADVKGNLTVMSRQDLAHGDSSSMNASGSLHLGPVPSVSLSLGGSSGTSDVAWVSEQTGLFSKGAITLHAKGDMTVAGAVTASESHQGSITAKTLTVTDILDHDTASSVSGQVGVSTPGAPGAIPGVTVSGSYAGHAIEQTTRGTIGDGIALTVRDETQSTPEDKINRDTTQAQVITKNQSAGVQVYASTNAVQEVSTGFEGIRKNLVDVGKASADGLSKLPDAIKDAAVKALALVDFENQTPAQAAGKLVDALAEDGKIDSDQKTSVKKAMADAVEQGLKDPQVSADLASCSGRRSFLHDLIFLPAYANGAVAAVCAAGSAAVAAALGMITGYNTGKIIAQMNDTPGIGHNGGPPLDDEQTNADGPEGPRDPSKILRAIRYEIGVGELFDEMKKQNIKFNEDDVLGVGQFYDGRIVFLEKGNENSGLQHIIDSHASEFLDIGVPPQYITNVVMRAVTEGKVVGYQGSGTGRPIYELIVNGQIQRIAVTVGSNGYIVGANPAGRPK